MRSRAEREKKSRIEWVTGEKMARHKTKRKNGGREKRKGRYEKGESREEG